MQAGDAFAASCRRTLRALQCAPPFIASSPLTSDVFGDEVVAAKLAAVALVVVVVVVVVVVERCDEADDNDFTDAEVDDNPGEPLRW